MISFQADTHPGYLLKIVQQELRKEMDHVLKAIHLTTPQYATLSSLQENPGISNAELARKSFVTPQTMNLIVKNLENRGLITRNEDAHHGRIQNIVLSKSGEKLLEKAHSHVEHIEKEVFSYLSKEELSVLTNLLMKVQEGILRKSED